MEKLNHDELYSIAIKLNLRNILRLSETSKKINEKLRTNYLWKKLLNRDFPNRKLVNNRKPNGWCQYTYIYSTNRICNIKTSYIYCDHHQKEEVTYEKVVNFFEKISDNHKDLYILLSGLTDLKKKLNLEEDIYRIYSFKELSLSNSGITKLPSSIRFLSNLKKLNIDFNYIKELPNCFPNSLEILSARNNQIKELPTKLPNSLQCLNLTFNQLKELHDNLPNPLQKLYVSGNQLKELPDRLPNCLIVLDASLNQLNKLPVLPFYLNVLELSGNQLKKREINKLETLYPYLTSVSFENQNRLLYNKRRLLSFLKI